MLIERLEHQKIRKGYNIIHNDNLNNLRRICVNDNHLNKLNHSIRISTEMESSSENPVLKGCTKILKLEKLRDTFDISLQRKLEQLPYDRRALIFHVSHSSLVHAISGSFFHHSTPN